MMDTRDLADLLAFLLKAEQIRRTLVARVKRMERMEPVETTDTQGILFHLALRSFLIRIRRGLNAILNEEHVDTSITIILVVHIKLANLNTERKEPQIQV